MYVYFLNQRKLRHFLATGRYKRWWPSTWWDHGNNPLYLRRLRSFYMRFYLMCLISFSWSGLGIIRIPQNSWVNWDTENLSALSGAWIQHFWVRVCCTKSCHCALPSQSPPSSTHWVNQKHQQRCQQHGGPMKWLGGDCMTPISKHT